MDTKTHLFSLLLPALLFLECTHKRNWFCYFFLQWDIEDVNEKAEFLMCSKNTKSKKWATLAPNRTSLLVFQNKQILSWSTIDSPLFVVQMDSDWPWQWRKRVNLLLQLVTALWLQDLQYINYSKSHTERYKLGTI